MGVFWCHQKTTDRRAKSRIPLLPLMVFSLCALSAQGIAVERRDVSGDLLWSSASLQGAAGIGALSESWVDQAFKDPSLLARRKQTVEIDLLSASTLISRDAADTLVDTIKAFAESNRGEGATSAASATASALDRVRSVFGKSMTTQSYTTLLGVRVSNVAVAPFASVGIDAIVDNVVWPKLDAQAGGLAGVLVAYSQQLKKDFDLGVALRPSVGGYKRYELDLSLFGDVLTENSDSAKSMADSLAFPSAVYVPLDLAFGWYAGAATRFHVTSQNTFGASPLHVLGGSPEKIPSRFNLGFSQQIAIRGSQEQKITLAGEFQDAFGLVGGWNEALMRTQWAARYSARLLSRDRTTFAVNVGLHSGYPVASLFLDIFLADLEVSWAARENGGHPGQRPNQILGFTLRSDMQF
jgi:hypothetical protein